MSYVPDHLPELVESLKYKPAWTFRLRDEVELDGSGGLTFDVVSVTPNSFDFAQTIRVRHSFLVPPASYNRDVWAAWLFDRIRDVETHEAGEFFRLDGVREFAPHHSNGEAHGLMLNPLRFHRRHRHLRVDAIGGALMALIVLGGLLGATTGACVTIWALAIG